MQNTTILEIATASARFNARTGRAADRLLMNVDTLHAMVDAHEAEHQWLARPIRESRIRGAFVWGMPVVIDHTLADGQFGFAVIE